MPFQLLNFLDSDGTGSRLVPKAIIFDLDGTLINSAIPFKKMKSRIIRYLEDAGVTPGLLNDEMLNFEITSKAVDDLKGKGFPPHYIERALNEMSNIMNEVELESSDDASLIPRVPETLEALKKRGLKIGLMTRSCREYAERILEKFGIRKYFDVIIARDEVEDPKPSPSHAIKLLELLNVPAEETLFVGDHWSDAECAKRAGLKFIYFRREENKPHREEPNILKIRNIKEILRIIKGNR